MSSFNLRKMFSLDIFLTNQLDYTKTIIPLFGLMGYLTIRPVARKGYVAIAHEAKPNGLLIRGP